MDFQQAGYDSIFGTVSPKSVVGFYGIQQPGFPNIGDGCGRRMKG
jgi:hypothetical protein